MNTVVALESSVKLKSKELNGNPFKDIELLSKFTIKGEQPTVLSGAITAKGFARTSIVRDVEAAHSTLFVAVSVML